MEATIHTVRLLLVCLVLLGFTACASHALRTAAPPAVVRETTTQVMLHGKPLTLHLAIPVVQATPRVLVLYASGDGGWFGTAVDMFRAIARAGYPVVGISARAFLRIERPRGRALNPALLAREYRQILDHAQTTLGTADTAQAVLSGWSRGAAFAVLAGGERPLANRVAGVIAIGLSDGEDLAVDEAAGDDGVAAESARMWPFEPYKRMASLGAMPVVVIQSTHDQYLSAARGRALFGADTTSRRFLTVEATNHRFSGGRAAFDQALRDAFHWVAATTPAPPFTPEVPR